MRPQHLMHLCCPACRGDLDLNGEQRVVGETLDAGTLRCRICGAEYPIVGGVARFVASENYASGFGLQWSIHATTQYDRHSGQPISKRRFFAETEWPRRLDGELLLEVGSGAGRFTDIAASTGAMVVSVDYSRAVEANYAANGLRPNVLIVQADVYALPLRPACFDKVLCIGVLQHTPDPRRAFLALPEYLKPGGELVIDVYARRVTAYLGAKYWVRPLTRRIAPTRLYAWVRRYVDLWWPLAGVLRQLPRIGPRLNQALLVPDYSALGLRGERLKEWAYLDAFDMLSPRYDKPQTLADVRGWFRDAGLEQVRVRNGYNGIEGKGRRPAGNAPTELSTSALPPLS